MATQQVAVSITGRDQQQLRLDEKLRRELGESVLTALSDHTTEDICLNPGGKLWANRQGDGWKQIGELTATQAYAAMGTIATQRGTVVNYDRPITLWVMSVAALSRMGKADPLMRPIYVRHVRHRPFYPAKSGIEAASVGTPSRWK